MCSLHTSSDLIDDWTTGDVICSACGLVVGGILCDDTPQRPVQDSPSKRLRIVRLHIDIMGGNLNMTKPMLHDALRIYESLDWVCKMEPTIAAALYIACKRAGVPRTFEEVGAVCDVSPMQIRRAYSRFPLTKADRTKLPDPDAYVDRFCTRLDESFPLSKRVSALIKKARNHGIGDNIPAMTAAAIHILSDHSTSSICAISGVSRNTLRHYSALMKPLA